MTIQAYDYVSVERKWQQHWYDEKIYEATKKQGNKFFIHFAYPGVSGYLHVGHMRGFTYCDIIARAKRMQGYDVLFPAGFHASGIPSIGFAKKVQRNDPQTIALLKEYGCDDATIASLKDPQQVVSYFSNVYVKDYWKKFGFLIDYSRLMSTISPGYQQFIKWQFQKLFQKELLIQKPHYAPFCPKCGPVAVDKSETDISQGGSAEILEFTIIKFRLADGTILPAATLRPETIFGVTNMWIHPEVTYKKIQVKDETWIVSTPSFEKLHYQHDDVTDLHEPVLGASLLGKKVTVPLINREVPILPGVFADPEVATGIVMSVPAHAPYDYIALVETKMEIEPITIIDVKDLGINPARTVCEQLGITTQKETEKLNEATDIVYKKEFHTGILNKNCEEYAGIKVSEIKDTVKERLMEQHLAESLKEFSEEVICRCGEQVIIKKIPDQWFIKYSDPTLTIESKSHVDSMTIFPDTYKEELPGILDWFDDRACIRKGNWLGTEFPFKKDWIIEPISDSTLYPAYYLFSKYVNEEKISVDEMTESFFDYVFFGTGDARTDVWRQIRDDCSYWYPVDINLGGKEHKTVHFPVFIMNHVAIMPEEKRPKGIFVHWWVTQKGKEKISKSKGGAEHVAEAALIYGVDAMRLYYVHVGSPFVDIEWDAEIVTKYKHKIANIYKFISNCLTIDKEPSQQIDTWFTSKIATHVSEVINAVNAFDLRVAANTVFYEIPQDMNWYLKRGGGNKEVISSCVNAWVQLMAPFTPHLAEELWSLNHDSLVSTSLIKDESNTHYSELHLTGEQLIASLLEDINEILTVTKITPKRIIMYTAPSWKNSLYQTALDLALQNSLDMGRLMKTIMTDESMKKHAKEVSKYAGKLVSEIKKLNTKDIKYYRTKIDETRYLSEAKTFLESLFHCTITIYSADDSTIEDPTQKARFAEPRRPAIYVE
ncbi:MAG: leucine--tRNA ligase [Candidatus Thermoplasmatota archaeon]|nr:leucine--tRNA ligase [Candidatus Thermoplasmatota archaeon]